MSSFRPQRELNILRECARSWHSTDNVLLPECLQWLRMYSRSWSAGDCSILWLRRLQNSSCQVLFLSQWQRGSRTQPTGDVICSPVANEATGTQPDKVAPVHADTCSPSVSLSKNTRISGVTRRAGGTDRSQWHRPVGNKIIFATEFIKNTGRTTLEGEEGESGDETIAKKNGHHFFRGRWLKRSSLFMKNMVIRWYRQLPHRVTPILVTPLNENGFFEVSCEDRMSAEI